MPPSNVKGKEADRSIGRQNPPEMTRRFPRGLPWPTDPAASRNQRRQIDDLGPGKPDCVHYIAGCVSVGPV